MYDGQKGQLGGLVPSLLNSWPLGGEINESVHGVSAQIISNIKQAGRSERHCALSVQMLQTGDDSQRPLHNVI